MYVVYKDMYLRIRKVYQMRVVVSKLTLLILLHILELRKNRNPLANKKCDGIEEMSMLYFHYYICI